MFQASTFDLVFLSPVLTGHNASFYNYIRFSCAVFLDCLRWEASFKFSIAPAQDNDIQRIKIDYIKVKFIN